MGNILGSFLYEFPIVVRPRLPKGRVHRLLIDRDQIAIASYDGYYGNDESEVLVSFAHAQVQDVRFIGGFGGRSCIIYVDQMGKECKLSVQVVDPGNEPPKEENKRMAEFLRQIYQDSFPWPESKWIVRLARPKSVAKFLYGLSLFAGLLFAGGLAFDLALLTIFSVIVITPSIVALGIDHIRLNTNWHPLLKLLSYIVIFIVVFSLALTGVALLEAMGLL